MAGDFQELSSYQVYLDEEMVGQLYISPDSTLDEVRQALLSDSMFDRTISWQFVGVLQRQETERKVIDCVQEGKLFLQTFRGSGKRDMEDGEDNLIHISMVGGGSSQTSGVLVSQGGVNSSISVNSSSNHPNMSALSSSSISSSSSSKGPKKRAYIEAAYDRPYVCGYKSCHKAFRERRALEEHVRIHTGEKPFKCKEEGCDRSFRTSTELSRHKKLHTGEKPFHCDFPSCGKQFRRKHHLTTHMRKHTGDKPYKCPYELCNKSFKHAISLKNHKKKHEPQIQKKAKSSKKTKKIPFKTVAEPNQMMLDTIEGVTNEDSMPVQNNVIL